MTKILGLLMQTQGNLLQYTMTRDMCLEHVLRSIVTAWRTPTPTAMVKRREKEKKMREVWT